MNQEDALPSHLLSSIPWFHELTETQQEKLCKIATLKRMAVGDVLFNEGDREDCVYVLLEGRLAVEMWVSTRGKEHICFAEPLDILGWSSLTPVVRQRTATATAVQPCQLLCIDGETLRQLCESDHDLGYLIMRRIANVVASNLLTTRLALMDIILQTSHDVSRQQVSF